MIDHKNTIHIVGAGLAGCECAYQLAKRGYQIILYEMRDKTLTPAHTTKLFAELVCSNSFGSQTDYSASGQLKWEAKELDSLILRCALQSQLPAGMALGVDRNLFSSLVTEQIKLFKNIEIKSKVVNSINEISQITVIATGPLTHETMATSIFEHFGKEFCYFFDAIAPIIETDSINTQIAWKADRWDKGTKDYFNFPLSKEEYFKFVDEISKAQKVTPRDFEQTPFFEGCMPIETFVERGPLSLRFGPCSSKGLINPKNNKRPFAVVQLRQDNKEGTAYNMVGFQTRMTYGEQKRIFRMIPGLENAEFLKLGTLHRNLYINSPKVLNSDLSSKKRSHLYFAGQITGVEGYFESTMIGLLVALFIDQKIKDQPFSPPPRATALGSLWNSITEERELFQPTNINFGLFPKLGDERPSSKKERRDEQIQRAQAAFKKWSV